MGARNLPKTAGQRKHKVWAPPTIGRLVVG